ncbi:MAG: hypothetical protein KGZ74_16225 [Chitinophagaceae bacterium]|nr:hypothetical protein [Chitinophagaceae bacterium]
MHHQIKTHERKQQKLKKEETKQSQQKNIDEQIETLAQILIDIYLNQIKNEQVINYSNGADAGSKNSITV